MRVGAHIKIDYPNPRNFCGGAFDDWIEVNLTDKCNGKCKWCIEKIGIHPKYHAPWEKITEAILSTEGNNIILLGGEPTLYKHLSLVINSLKQVNKKVYITTNGSRINTKFIEMNLNQIDGINISIHHYNLDINKKITGIKLTKNTLTEAIKKLHGYGGKVRLNCNCISGYIDSKEQILNYIDFAKQIGVDSVRFAELKLDNLNFVDLAKVFDYRYGLNDNPYADGCVRDTIINDMQVNFRQMCGLNIAMRCRPKNPQSDAKKRVVYYDGKVYDGWQQQQPKEFKTPSLEQLYQLRDKKISIAEVLQSIN